MFRLGALALLVSFLSSSVFAQEDEQSPREMIEEGGRLIEDGEFDAAAKLFRKVVKKEEDNPQAWLMLGYALHMDGKLDEALKMHMKTASFRATKGIGLYNVGCAYALKGDKDKAFDYLNQAVKARFAQMEQFANEDDLKSLRDDIRYKRLEKRIDGEEITDDFKATGMVGRWITVSIVRAGEKDDPKASYSDVGKDSYVLYEGENKQGPIPYTVDVSKLVPTMTVAGQAKGILKMKGDLLTICLSQGGDAPTKFESTKDNGHTMMVVRRAVTADRLKGTWAYVSGSRAGADVAKERLVGEVTVTGETFTLPAGPTDKFVMKYELDSDTKMDMIDLEIQSGPVPEGKAVGIVKPQGDTMMFCYDPTGQKRPTEFKTTEDDGFFMFTLKRMPAKK